jgi:acetyltransferase-like isoleucine patch superfamily enzyme
VIGARTIVTQDIPPFCVVAGNPARIVNKLPFPEELIEKLGRDAYLKYENAVIER